MKTARRKTTVNLILGGMVACGICAGLPSVHANTVTENFDYTDGVISTNHNGGTGWAAAYRSYDGGDGVTESKIDIASGQLYYDNATTNSGTTSIYRDIATPFSSGTVYASVRMEDLNDDQRYWGIKLYSGGTEKMLIGQGSGRENWTIDGVTTNSVDETVIESSVDSNASTLLLVKLELGAYLGTHDLITFWVNPDLSSGEDVGTSVGGTSYIGVSPGELTTIRVIGGGYSSTYGVPEFNIDDIRISDVTPFALQDPATIVSWSTVSDSVMKLVIDAPWAADLYYPKATTNLNTPWAAVSHSDDGVHDFVVTNLSYSTAEGTNEVIYVETTNAIKFFGIGEE